MDNTALKLKSANASKQFPGRSHSWWDNRSAIHNVLRSRNQNDQEFTASLARYHKICKAFGFKKKNPHQEILTEMARLNAFTTLERWAEAIVEAVKGIRHWENQDLTPRDLTKPQSYAELKERALRNLAKRTPPRDMNSRGRFDYNPFMIFFDDCYSSSKNFLKNPKNAEIILSELPAFLKVFPALEGCNDFNKSRLWTKFRLFAKKLPLEQALHFAMCAVQEAAYKMNSSTGWVEFASPDLERYLSNDDTALKRFAMFCINCESIIGGWLAFTGRLSCQLAKHVAPHMANDLLFSEIHLIDNPVFSKIPAETAIKLCCGVKPADLAPGLSRQEAHQWLMHMTEYGEITPHMWLAQSLGVNPLFVRPATTLTTRTSTEVIRWLAVKQNTSAFKVFARVFVNGKVKEVSFSAYLDEITPEDLVNGLDTAPAVALRASRIRQAKQRAERRGQTLDLEQNFPDPELPVVDGITRIENVDQLINEGVTMGHCVGGVNYQVSCATGEDAIYSVNTEAGRSTLQLERYKDRWMVAQHLGALNTTPEEANQKLVAIWLQKLGEDKVATFHSPEMVGNRLHQAFERMHRPLLEPVVYQNALAQIAEQYRQNMHFQ